MLKYHELVAYRLSSDLNVYQIQVGIRRPPSLPSRWGGVWRGRGGRSRIRDNFGGSPNRRTAPGSGGSAEGRGGRSGLNDARKRSRKVRLSPCWVAAELDEDVERVCQHRNAQLPVVAIFCEVMTKKLPPLLEHLHVSNPFHQPQSPRPGHTRQRGRVGSGGRWLPKCQVGQRRDIPRLRRF